MEWLFYALLCAAIFGAVQLIDKIILGRLEVPPAAYLFIIGLAFLPGAVFVYSLGIKPCPPTYALLATFTGALFFVFGGGFFYMLRSMDAPVVSALFYIKLIFVSLWGFLFFQEVFAWFHYLGMGLIVLAAVALTFVGSKRKRKSILNGKVLAVLIGTTLLGSVLNAAAKYGLETVDVKTWFFYERLGAIPAILVMLGTPDIRRSAFRALRSLRGWLLVILGSELFSLVAIFAALKAYSVGPLTLVTVVASTTPLFATVFILAFDYIAPRLIPDEATRTHWKQRTVLITLGLLGIYLITIKT